MATASAAFTFEGAAGSLLVLETTDGATVTAELDSLDGVSTVAWSVYSTDETTDAGDYALTTSGPKGSIVTFAAGSAGTAGLLQCRINGGINPQTGATEAAYTKRAKWHVPTDGGLEVGCVDEAFESDPIFGTTGIVNAAVRSVGAGSSVTSVTGTAPIVSSGGATPAISISAANGSGPGSMSVDHYTLCAGATDAATVSTLVKRDAAGRFKAVAGVASDDVAVVSQLGGGAPSRIVALDANDIAEWALDDAAEPWADGVGSLDLTGYGGLGVNAPDIITGGALHGDRSVFCNWNTDTGLRSDATVVGEEAAGTVHGWALAQKNGGLLFAKDEGASIYLRTGGADASLDYPLYAKVGDSGEVQVLPGVASYFRGLVRSGEWTHFAMTWGANVARVYVNGVLLPTTVPYTSITWGAGRWRFGKCDGLGVLNGLFNQWRLCDVARSAAYIDEVYKRAVGRYP